MGREAAGVRGIKLGEGHEVVGLIVVGEGNILTASETGYGKLTPLDDFPAHGRGGQGVIALQTSDRNGATVAALQVTKGQEVMLISSTGTLVRTPVDEISVVGRNTQGVRLIRLGEGERLVGIERIDESLEGAAEGEGSEGVPVPAKRLLPRAVAMRRLAATRRRRIRRKARFRRVALKPRGD